jgi:hypothetical protein
MYHVAPAGVFQPAALAPGIHVEPAIMGFRGVEMRTGAPDLG